MKRVLSVLLVLCLIVTLMPGLAQTVWADEIAGGSIGDGLTWSLDSGGVLTISGDGPLPDYKNYKPEWYSYKESIYKVILEPGITIIGYGAFSMHTALTSVEIKGNVTEIGETAFFQCNNLAEINLPESLTTIGDRAFSYCISLSKIELPEGLKKIGYWAFLKCSGLTEISIPDSVEEVVEDAFNGCTGLTSITIGSGLTSLYRTFWGCKGLTDVSIPENITELNETFVGCAGLKNVDLPNTVVSINGAFQNCTGLTEARIPESVTSANGAFSLCTGLKEAVIPDNVKSATGIFSYCSNLSKVTIGTGVSDLSNSFAYCSSLTDVVIPQNVTDLNNTFLECTSLQELIIPDGVKRIGRYTFMNCSSLTEIVIPDSVTKIDIGAFTGCSRLKRAVIGDGVTELPAGSFSGCTSLTEVVLGDSITVLGSAAFYNCSSLSEIRIPGNVQVMENSVFYGNSSLKEVKFAGNAPVEIDEKCFESVTATVYYPENDVTWEESLFQDYGGDLTWVAYEAPVIIVAAGQCGDELYWERDSLGTLRITGTGPMWNYSLTDPPSWRSTVKAVIIEEGATSIGDYAFADCEKLKSAVLPETLTTIGGFAFWGDPNIPEIVFPKGLASIGTYAFQQCGLKRAFFTGSAPDIAEGAFWGDRLAAYYDDSDESWYRNAGTDRDVRQDYGGRICWAVYMADPDIPERMSGRNRQGTAVAISKAAFPDGAENIVIASGDSYPDALAGGPLAYLLDAPILLVCKSNPDRETLDEITRLGAKHAYILGGIGAVGKNVEEILTSKGLTVERIAGPSRYETSIAVANKMDEIRGGKPKVVFFVFSNNYPDALSTSNVAAIIGAPIMYIEGSGKMRDPVRKYMDSCGKVELSVIIGGQALISSNADNSLKRYGEVERLFGSNRYETNVQINAAFSEILSGDSMCVACGTNYPDALSGSVLAAASHAPLLLVQGNSISKLQQDYVYWKTPLNVFAFGGTGVLSEKVIDDIKYYAL